MFWKIKTTNQISISLIYSVTEKYMMLHLHEVNFYYVKFGMEWNKIS